MYFDWKVLISPAIYVYRNQVAQREAGRVMLLLFCPFRHSQSARYSHDIATPLVMGGLGVSGMTPQLNRQPGESRLGANCNSNAVVSSRRSSSLVTNNSLTDSPTRKGSDDPSVTVIALAQASTVVNWRGRSGSVDCRVLARNNLEDTCLSLVPSPHLPGKRRPSKARASISGACGTYSLDRRPSSSATSYEANQIEMRQRSQTFCETRLTTPGRHQPPAAPSSAGVSPRAEVVSNVTLSSDRSGRTKKRLSSSTTAAAAAAAAAAVAAAELKALNHPLAYPSLDFFDIGLEDYGRRSTSSFSRFIQQASPLPPQPPPPAPLLPHIPQPSSSQTTNGRRRRTCSFSKVLSRGGKQQQPQQQTGSRWPAVFGSGKQQEIGKRSASSMPSVQQIPSLVTAVWKLFEKRLSRVFGTAHLASSTSSTDPLEMDSLSRIPPTHPPNKNMAEPGADVTASTRPIHQTSGSIIFHYFHFPFDFCSSFLPSSSFLFISWKVVPAKYFQQTKHNSRRKRWKEERENLDPLFVRDITTNPATHHPTDSFSLLFLFVRLLYINIYCISMLLLNHCYIRREWDGRCCRFHFYLGIHILLPLLCSLLWWLFFCIQRCQRPSPSSQWPLVCYTEPEILSSSKI